MIRSVHRLAPWVLCLTLLAIGLTMGANAAGDGTPASGIVTSWAEWIVGNAIALVGGLIAWTQLTLHGTRKNTSQAIMEHDSLEGAHKPAAAHNHKPIDETLHKLEVLLAEVSVKLGVLIDGQEAAVNELTDQDTRLGSVESRLEQLLTEHCFLHGQALRKRSDDPSTFTPDDVRGHD